PGLIETLAAVAASLLWHLARAQDESTAALYLGRQNQQDFRRTVPCATRPTEQRVHEDRAQTIRPRGAGWPRRASNLPQRRGVVRARARGHRDIVTVVGHAATLSAGEWITASGEWVNDRTHGQQFKARFLRTSPPTSADGIEKYLSSGMIRGVG